MNDLLISFAIVAFVPFLSLIVFRANAAVLFFAACAGIVLLTGLDPSVVSTSAALLPGEGESFIRLTVVLLSLLLSGLFAKNAVRKPAGYALHGLLSLLTSIMLWLTLPATTGLSLLTQVTTQDLWITIHNYETLIVAASFALSLIVILRRRR